ncbi:MAG: bifunctional DNA-formamidopyrimidine glycosylase/DNA-(apurinic or apyrimidinic site) lyase [Patescibacteria group bacterium]
MPELPEVYTISQDLKKNIIGYKIKNIQISKYYKLPSPINTKLKNTIGLKILDVDNIAKNVVIKLSKNTYIVFHLAMTGRILLRESSHKDDNWVKVVLELEKNKKTVNLKFADMRQFGKLLVLNKQGLSTLTNKYGLSPLEDKITPEKFLKAIKSKRSNIKNVLLDQKIISGVGNIYATDSLFLSKIHPKVSTQDITLGDATKLLKSVRQVLKEGIKNRGSTLPDKMYVDIFGNEGHQQNHFKIYLKQKCPVCNSKVEFIKINGRGTYLCPTCQVYKNTSNTKLENEENKKQRKLF